uniref:VOC domain-containing protein n=1 Tax=Strigamia maritima TaxID=126957 RepID=T1JNN5_STRMM
MELTYNYGVGTYKMGNDFMGIFLQSSEAIEKGKLFGWLSTVENDYHVMEAPGGYKFYILDRPQPKDKDPVMKVQLACENLDRSINYWRQLCQMNVYSQSSNHCELGYGDEQCKLEFMCINKPVDHAKGFGRIAFSCPSAELPDIEKVMKEKKNTILTPLLSLDTPGKATVHVVILADPDGHEVCFVGDEAFRELSVVDAKANSLLEGAIATDKSDEWFARKGLSKIEG